MIRKCAAAGARLQLKCVVGLHGPGFRIDSPGRAPVSDWARRGSSPRNQRARRGQCPDPVATSTVGPVERRRRAQDSVLAAVLIAVPRLISAGRASAVAFAKGDPTRYTTTTASFLGEPLRLTRHHPQTAQVHR